MVKITFKRNIRFRKYVAFCSAVLHAALQYQSINMADIQSPTRPASSHPARQGGGRCGSKYLVWMDRTANQPGTLCCMCYITACCLKTQTGFESLMTTQIYWTIIQIQGTNNLRYIAIYSIYIEYISKRATVIAIFIYIKISDSDMSDK